MKLGMEGWLVIFVLWVHSFNPLFLGDVAVDLNL